MLSKTKKKFYQAVMYFKRRSTTSTEQNTNKPDEQASIDKLEAPVEAPTHPAYYTLDSLFASLKANPITQSVYPLQGQVYYIEEEDIDDEYIEVEEEAIVLVPEQDWKLTKNDVLSDLKTLVNARPAKSKSEVEAFEEEIKKNQYKPEESECPPLLASAREKELLNISVEEDVLREEWE
jgi:hypothetical protein